MKPVKSAVEVPKGLSPNKAAAVLAKMLKTDTPVFLWGAPGTGKSESVRRVAANYGGHFIDVRAATTDPVDWRGVPAVVSGRTAWCPPDFLPREGKGVLFLDELPNAPPLVQSALLELSLDRRIGDYRLPDDWKVVAAGNRQEDRAGANRVISSLLNRFVHVDVGVNPDEWVTWAMTANVAPEIVSYIKRRPDQLYGFDPTRNERAYCTPRSWKFASDVLEAFRSPSGSAYEEDEALLLMAALSGTVGAGAAAEFLGHLRAFALLPDPKDLLAKPETTPLPDDPSLVYALILSVVSVVRKDHGLLDGFAVFTRRIPPEYAFFAIAQVRAGLNNDEAAKLMTKKGYAEAVAVCRKGGIRMTGI